MKLKRGSTSVRRTIFIADSSSTTGAGLASLAYNSAGLVAYYYAADLSNEVQITLASATLGSYTSGGFVAVDNTNMPGWYEIGIPDAALDAGNEVCIQLRGATNMVPVNIYIELDAVDYQTDAFGALKPTTAGRTLDVTATGAAGIDWSNVENPATTINLSGTTIKTATDVETDTAAIQGDVTTLLSRLTSGRASNLDNLDVAISVIQSQIMALNNLSAKANWFGSLLLEIPDSGTRDYLFELVVRDDEDKLVNLDGLPTIALVNAAGTDRSSLITTAIANPATGRYTLTITISTSTVNESLKLTASGTVSGEARYAVIAPQVVDYDSATQINTILTRIGTPAVSVSDDIAALNDLDSTAVQAAAAAALTAYDPPTNAEMQARTLAATDYATSAALSALASVFTGITSIGDWIRRIVRKDVGTAGMATAETEINTGGSATFAGTSDSLEAIRDRGDAEWTTGGGGGGGGTISEAVVVARLPIGATVGWPKEFIIGDARLTALSTAPKLFVKDIDDNILTALGSKNFTDADFSATLRLAPLTTATRDVSQPPATIEVSSDDDPGIVYNDDTAGSEYFELQIPQAQAALGVVRTEYSCQFIMNWGNDDTYQSTINLGIAKFVRKNAAPEA